MARPTKQGIDYFPLDVDFLRDIKTRKIMKGCGLASPAILICLLANIYRNDGYYAGWDSDLAFLVADEVGASDGAVGAVVCKAVQVGFFDEGLFREHSILTSAGIQARFFSIARKRKNIKVRTDYLLVDIDEIINGGNNPVNGGNNPVNSAQSTQSKAKESKGKERKDKTICPWPPNAEQEQAAMGAVITLALNDGTEYPIFEGQAEKWAGLYPAVDVMQQLRNMKGWLEANPAKRKTKSDILRFANRWLAKTQDRGGDGHAPPQAGARRAMETKNEKNNRLLMEIKARRGLLGKGGGPHGHDPGAGGGEHPGLPQHDVDELQQGT